MSGGKVDSIDIAKDRLDIAIQRKRITEKKIGRSINCNFLQMSLLDCTDEPQYDIIWMEQAFHHLEPREQIVAKISRLLKPGGYLVISEANAANPLVQAQLFKVRGLKTIGTYKNDSGEDFQYGNERVLTASRLSRWSDSAGIRKKNIYYFRVFPNREYADRFFRFETSVPQWLIPIFTHYNYIGQKI